MIAIVDYGAGNLRSVYNAFEAIGRKTTVTKNPVDLSKADAIVLPGVGSFGDGMASLRQTNLIDALNEEVIGKKKPYLGICLGMQFLADRGEENGEHKGLGWIPGVVRLIRPNSPEFRIPHIGWNDLDVRLQAPLFDGIEDRVFYFVHSYHFEPEGDGRDCISSVCDHGTVVTASVQRDNIYGVQFHPEKSQRSGLDLLVNFVNMI